MTAANLVAILLTPERLERFFSNDALAHLPERTRQDLADAAKHYIRAVAREEGIEVDARKPEVVDG